MQLFLKYKFCKFAVLMNYWHYCLNVLAEMIEHYERQR